MTFNKDTSINFHEISNNIAIKANFKITILLQLYQNNDKFINYHLVNDTDQRIENISNSDLSDENQFDFIQSICDYYRLSSETQDILSNYLLVACYSLFEKAFKKR